VLTVLTVLFVASGLLLGVQIAFIWGLRRSRRGPSDRLLGALILFPLGYFTGASAFGWPTPGSLAESAGLLTGLADRALFVALTVVPAAVVVAVLVRSGVTRRLEEWSAGPGELSASTTSAPPPEQG